MASNFCIPILVEVLAIFCIAGVLNGLATFGYYTLLFKTSLTFFVAALSFIFFGVALVCHSLAVAVGISALYQTRLTQIYDSSASYKKNCLTILCGIIVVIILILQFATSIYGLVFSIDIVRSNFSTCPLEDNYTCHLIVLCFFLTIAFSLLRREFFRNSDYKDINGEGSYNGLFQVNIKTNTIIKDEVKNVITEITKNGITKKITIVTDKDGQTTTKTEIFGPDGRPIEDENKRRVNGSTLFRTFVFDPRSSIRTITKQMEQRKQDLESGEATEMQPLSS